MAEAKKITIVIGDKVRPRGVSEEFCLALEANGARPELVAACRREPRQSAIDEMDSRLQRMSKVLDAIARKLGV